MSEGLEHTSKKLLQGEFYSRHILAQFFDVKYVDLFQKRWFIPESRRFNSVWIFITQADIASDLVLLDNQALHYCTDGSDHFLEQLRNHKKNDLEILVFIQVISATSTRVEEFEYVGNFEYCSESKTSFITLRKYQEFFAVDLPPNVPAGEINVEVLQKIVEDSNDITALYFFLSILHLLSSYGSSFLHYVPLSVLGADILANVILADKISGLNFNGEPTILWFGKSFDVSAVHSLSTDLKGSVESELRLEKPLTPITIAAQVLQKFLEPFGTSSSASARQIMEESREIFIDGQIPFWFPSDLFLQIHPAWINYFDENKSTLSLTFAACILKYFGLEERDFLSCSRSALYFSSDWIEKCLNSHNNSAYRESNISASLTTKVISAPEVAESTARKSSEAGSFSPNSVSAVSSNQIEKSFTNEDLELVHEFEEAIITLDGNECELPELTPPSLPSPASNKSHINFVDFQNHFRCMSIVEQLSFLCLIETFVTRTVESSITPLSILSEKFYLQLWLLHAKGFAIGETFLLEDLQYLRDKPPENWKLYNRAFVSDLSNAIRKRLTHQNVLNVSRTLQNLSNRIHENDSENSLNLKITSSTVSIENSNWFIYLFENWSSIRVWAATHLVLSLQQLNPIRLKIPEAIFDLQIDLRDAVLLEIETLQLSNATSTDNSFKVFAKSTDLLEEAATISDINKDVADDFGNSVSLPCLSNAEVNLNSLARLFENTSTGYKFFFFIAIVNLISSQHEPNFEIELNEILTEMLVAAAKVVSLNPNINFGSQDRLLDELLKLNIRVQKYAVGWSEEKETFVRATAAVMQHTLNTDLLRYAPYLLIRPLLEDLLSKSLTGDSLNAQIAQLSIDHYEDRNLFYKIEKNRKRIVLHYDWITLLRDEKVQVISWFYEQFSVFLLKRNPHLRNICFEDQFDDEIESISDSHDFSPIAENLSIINALKPETSVAPELDDDRFVSNFAIQSEDVAIINLTTPAVQATQDSGSTHTFESPAQSHSYLHQNSNTFNYSTVDFDKAAIASENSSTYLTYPKSIDAIPPTFPLDETGVSDQNLFNDISHEEGALSIEKGFERVFNKIESLERPRSLGEIHISDADYQWLKNWLYSLALETATSFLKSDAKIKLGGHPRYSRREAIGSLLLLSCTEINRREGREGAVWPLFLSATNKKAHSVMISERYEGNPSAYVITSFKEAISALDLRHVLEQDDHAKYLISIFLQFGITRYGIRNIPSWLSRQNLTESIRQLISDNSPNYSALFVEIWEAFHRFLHARLSEKDLRILLCKTYWFPEEWHDDIVFVLRNPEARLSLAVPGLDGFSNRLRTVVAKLIWDLNDPPQFLIEVNSDRLALDLGKTYRTSANALTCKLMPTSVGGWQLTLPLKFSMDEKEVSVRVDSNDGINLYSEELLLWDDAIDVQVFDLLSGRKLEEEASMSQKRSYAIWASSDLLPNIDLTIRRNFLALEKTMYLLPEGWNGDFKLLLDGETLWSAAYNTSNTGLSSTLKAIVPFIERKTLAPGEPIKIAFRGETESCKVESLRIGGISVALKWNGERTETVDPVSLGSNAFRGPVDLLLKVRNESRLSILRHKLRVVLNGSAYSNGIAWKTFDETSSFTVEECRKNSFVFKYKSLERVDISDYAIFEGNALCQRLTNAKANMARVHGSGAPLEIRRVFNSGAQHPRIVIADSVYDPGCLHSHTILSDFTIRFDFHYAVELSPKHTAILWAEDTSPVFITGDDIKQINDTSWMVSTSVLGKNLAVGLAYDKVFSGALLPSDPEKFLDSIQWFMPVGEIAALLAWMRWPLLRNDIRRSARKFVHSFPAETLTAWIDNSFLDYRLEKESLTYLSSWHNTTRELFSDWSPSEKNIGAFINKFQCESAVILDAEALQSVCKKIWEVSPLLMSKVLVAAFNDNNFKIDNESKREILESIEADILFLEFPTTFHALKERYGEVLDDCTKDLNIDRGFLGPECKRVIQSFFAHTLDERQIDHLFVLQSLFKGRQILAWNIINHILHQ